jgi:hypothetical protein
LLIVINFSENDNRDNHGFEDFRDSLRIGTLVDSEDHWIDKIIHDNDGANYGYKFQHRCVDYWNGKIFSIIRPHKSGTRLVWATMLDLNTNKIMWLWKDTEIYFTQLFEHIDAAHCALYWNITEHKKPQLSLITSYVCKGRKCLFHDKHPYNVYFSYKYMNPVTYDEALKLDHANKHFFFHYRAKPTIFDYPDDNTTEW